MDVNRPLAWMPYQAIMSQFTTFTTNRSYDKTKIFSDNELTFLTLRHVYRFMAMHAYGRVNPSAEDDPISGRGSTLRYWKKVISYFVPNKLVQRWTTIGGATCGNPTKSTLANNRHIAIKKETRGIGSQACADRALTEGEFKQGLDLLNNCRASLIQRKHFIAMLKFHFHLIGRKDDTAHVLKSSIK